MDEDSWVAYLSKSFGIGSEGKQLSMKSIDSNPSTVLTFNFIEVKEALSQCTSNKAPGPDGTPIDFFTELQDLWAPVLTNDFNVVAKVGLPESWSKSIIILIFKKEEKSEPNNYRSMSLLGSTAKRMGRVLLNRLEEWAISNNVLIPTQHGFKKGKGTRTNV